MSGNNTIETASTEVTSIWRRNNVEKSTRRTHWYFVSFESRIHVEISTSNRCHNFHVDSPFKIDVISTNFPRRISTSNRWRINENESIASEHFFLETEKYCFFYIKLLKKPYLKLHFKFLILWFFPWNNTYMKIL